ncbi:1-acyl-sn-glycerol-3-phosphate acyltransferase [Sphaerotilus hippei]|uniref:1-acyl-sn-glycerol-3-phosphate acyltransferase n=1 Tax=Sphaerotilus hippei TaxID=744406 RepID=A0A318H146_9BURK|nr:lysophospholipid acyltransferase family protein [Sphaerotilus hippei]PXW96645.1 1-acyl-sn-glycerol-3-phosphate acyltransferase [Sphaerotilus hippei]
MRRLRVLLWPWLAFMLLWLGVLSLAWNLVAFVLQPLLPERRAGRIGRAGIAYGYRLYWATARASGLMRIEADALDVLRDEPGGLIIAANHPSMLDALAIVARLPRSVCIMKASLMRNVFLGAGARLARYICNDSPRTMIRASVRSLSEGGQLVLFPEGTRSVGGRLNPFLPGITSIADKAQVPIQTVLIETDSPYLGKGWPLWRLPPIPIVFHLRPGRRFAPRTDHAAALAELEAYFRDELGSPARPASPDPEPTP